MKPRYLLLGLQHTVAMFGATVLVPLLTGLNPSVALFTAGLGTLVFHLVTGRMVPVFLGSSFAFITPILAAKEAGFSLSAIGGGLVAAGLVYGLFALLVLLIGSQRVRWVFPPVVTGPVIVVIGLTLAPVAVQMASKDWLLAIVTFASAVVSAVFFRGLFFFSPKLAALLQTLPQGVLGGISMLLFGMIASIGIRTLAEAEIDFTKSRNLIVVSAILVLGLGGAVANLGTIQVAGAALPLKVSGMALAALAGVVLNLLLPQKLEPEGLANEEERIP
jgi:uracil permease